jgi:hypothetical protein
VLRREITEDIEIDVIPLADLRSMVLRGEITDAPSALAILLASEAIEREELAGFDGLAGSD